MMGLIYTVIGQDMTQNKSGRGTQQEHPKTKSDQIGKNPRVKYYEDPNDRPKSAHRVSLRLATLHELIQPDVSQLLRYFFTCYSNITDTCSFIHEIEQVIFTAQHLAAPVLTLGPKNGFTRINKQQSGQIYHGGNQRPKDVNDASAYRNPVARSSETLAICPPPGHIQVEH